MGRRPPSPIPPGHYARRQDEQGLPIPKLSRDPRAPKDFESHTERPGTAAITKAGSWAAFLQLMHQLGIRMTQKWELFLFFLTSCFGVLRRDMAKSHPKCFCASCTNQILENTPWKAFWWESLESLNSFSFPLSPWTTQNCRQPWSKGCISASELIALSLPHPTGNLTLFYTKTVVSDAEGKGNDIFQNVKIYQLRDLFLQFKAECA